MYSEIERLPEESYSDWKRRAYDETSSSTYECYECGSEKLGSEFTRNQSSADGRILKCKECSNRYSRERAATLKDEKRVLYDATADDLFTCRMCGEEKPGSKFPFSTGSADGRALSRCYACHGASQRAGRDGDTLKLKPGSRVSDLKKPPQFDARKAFFEAKDHYAKRAHVAKMVQNAVRSGRLIKPDACELCGKNHGTQIEGHHFKSLDDLLYEDILQVVFLCQPCHLKAHDGNFKNPPLHPFALARMG